MTDILEQPDPCTLHFSKNCMRICFVDDAFIISQPEKTVVAAQFTTYEQLAQVVCDYEKGGAIFSYEIVTEPNPFGVALFFFCDFGTLSPDEAYTPIELQDCYYEYAIFIDGVQQGYDPATCTGYWSKPIYPTVSEVDGVWEVDPICIDLADSFYFPCEFFTGESTSVEVYVKIRKRCGKDATIEEILPTEPWVVSFGDTLLSDGVYPITDLPMPPLTFTTLCQHIEARDIYSVFIPKCISGFDVNFASRLCIYYDSDGVLLGSLADQLTGNIGGVVNNNLNPLGRFDNACSVRCLFFVNGNDFPATVLSDFTINYTKECYDEIIYYKERTGSIRSATISHVTNETIETSGEEICNTDECEDIIERNNQGGTFCDTSVVTFEAAFSLCNDSDIKEFFRGLAYWNKDGRRLIITKGNYKISDKFLKETIVFTYKYANE